MYLLHAGPLNIHRHSTSDRPYLHSFTTLPARSSPKSLQRRDAAKEHRWRNVMSALRTCVDTCKHVASNGRTVSTITLIFLSTFVLLHLVPACSVPSSPTSTATGPTWLHLPPPRSLGPTHPYDNNQNLSNPTLFPQPWTTPNRIQVAMSNASTSKSTTVLMAKSSASYTFPPPTQFSLNNPPTQPLPSS